MKKQFIGIDITEMPQRAAEGSTFLNTKTKEIYIYGKDRKPSLSGAEGDFVSNDTTYEITGALPVETAVFITQAEYDAGTPNDDTLYIITDSASGYTVATLPASPETGDRAFVTDATVPSYLGTLTGGGAVVCPVFYNGLAWISA